MSLRQLILAVGLAAVAAGATPDVEQARNFYRVTEFEKSLQILQAIPSKSAEIYALMGRNHYGLADYRKATEALEKAFAADPDNWEYALWLGRAYGRRAETSSPFTAPGYASKTRQYFEKAVQLSPRNLEALSDLFEYYLEAPGFLGGGFDKAAAIAQRIFQIEPAQGHAAEARLAERRKQFDSAEDHLRRAAQAAPQQVGRLVDLARFLTQQGRYDEAEQNFAKAEKLAPDQPSLIYERAATYVQSHRNLGVAKDLLKRYMQLQLTPDDPPKSEAAKLLRQAQGN